MSQLVKWWYLWLDDISAPSVERLGSILLANRTSILVLLNRFSSQQCKLTRFNIFTRAISKFKILILMLRFTGLYNQDVMQVYNRVQVIKLQRVHSSFQYSQRRYHRVSNPGPATCNQIYCQSCSSKLSWRYPGTSIYLV